MELGLKPEECVMIGRRRYLGCGWRTGGRAAGNTGEDGEVPAG